MNEETPQKQPVRRVQVSAGQADQRLDNFLSGQLPGIPRSLVYRLIRTGQVRVNGGRAKPGTRLQSGDEVRIPPAHTDRGRAVRAPQAVVESLAAAIVYQDADLLVIDKPAGLAVHAGSGVHWGVIDALRQARPGEDIELTHRLDRETSGVLVVARNKGAMRALQAQFRHGETDKRYLCLMDGRLPEARVRVDQPLLKTERGGEHFVVVDPRGKAAVTEFRLLEYRSSHTFAEAIIMTGRTHQIRAHAAFLGLPLAGDPRYLEPGRLRYWQERGLHRLFLHAHSLSFTDRLGERRQFSAPLPAELRAVLDAI